MKFKASSSNYSKAMLPRTRKAQFLDCFKMNYIVLLKCGLMLILFFSPMVLFSLFMDFYYMSLINVSKEEVEQTILVFNYIYNLGIVLLSFVGLIGVTGVIRVLRNLIWGEGIYFLDDFNKGVKQNYGKNAIFNLIFSAFYALSYFIYSLFSDSIIAYFSILMFVLIFLPIYFWILLLNNVYESKIGKLLKFGLFFFVKTIGWSMLFAVITVLPVLFILIPFEFIWIKFLVLIPFIIFVYPILYLTAILYSTAKFDIFINQDNYPDYYRKGLNID